MSTSPIPEERILLTEAQRVEIDALKAANDWPQAYRRLEEFARANGKIKPEVPNWYHLAAQINDGKGPLAVYVRSAMMISAARKGIVLTPQVFQVASDKLALGIVDTILKWGIPIDNAQTLISDVVDSSADMGLAPEDWAGSAANAIKQGPLDLFSLEIANRFVARVKDLPYADIGTFEGDVFWNKEDGSWPERNAIAFTRFLQAAGRQDLASYYAGLFERPEAMDFLLTGTPYRHPKPGGGPQIRERFEPVPGIVYSPAVKELFGDIDFVDMPDDEKQKWQKFLAALKEDPRIGAPYGVSAAAEDKLYLVSDGGTLHLNNRLLTSLTPAEAVQRQQMRAVRAVAPPEAAVPGEASPASAPPPHPDAIPGVLPQGPWREGRARPAETNWGGLHAAPMAFPQPPEIWAQNSEQKGIDLSFPPLPSLVEFPGNGGMTDRAPIALPLVAAEDRPATVQDVQAAQEALLIDLHIADTNRAPPELDIPKIRALLAREFEREVRCGRSIYTDPF